MKNIFSLILISLFVILVIQPVNAFDYTETSSQEFPFPINITILETIGTYTYTSNNESGNFTHYLIGFEIFLENYSLTLKNDKISPRLENYTYDPFGQRIKIVRNDSANTTIYTPFKELMRIVNSSGTYDFTYVYDGNTLIARVNPDGSKWYYHSDHLGSTSLITDQNGNVVENTFYSPYGELLGGGTSDVKLYTGQFSDDLTNQYYYGARYYKPSTGQFVSPDSLIQQVYNPQNLNRYSYTWNNPYKYVDTSGLRVVQFGFTGSVNWFVGATGGAGIAFSNSGYGEYQLGIYYYGGTAISTQPSLKAEYEQTFSERGRYIEDIKGGSDSVEVGASYIGSVNIGKSTPVNQPNVVPDVQIKIGVGGKVFIVGGSVQRTETNAFEIASYNKELGKLEILGVEINLGKDKNNQQDSQLENPTFESSSKQDTKKSGVSSKSIWNKLTNLWSNIGGNRNDKY